MSRPLTPTIGRAASSHEARCARIYEIIGLIPAGRVSTYGQIADLAGLGRAARFVGRALRHADSALDIPWHRVINARGTISFPVGSEHYEEQRRLLEEEGVVMLHGRVDLRRFRWEPSLDQLLWGPMA